MLVTNYRVQDPRSSRDKQGKVTMVGLVRIVHVVCMENLTFQRCMDMASRYMTALHVWRIAIRWLESWGRSADQVAEAE